MIEPPHRVAIGVPATLHVMITSPGQLSQTSYTAPPRDNYDMQGAHEACPLSHDVLRHNKFPDQKLTCCAFLALLMVCCPVGPALPACHLIYIYIYIDREIYREGIMLYTYKTSMVRASLWMSQHLEYIIDKAN
jgi:hypothetical protein